MCFHNESAVTDVAEKENLEPMADQVINNHGTGIYVFLLNVFHF